MSETKQNKSKKKRRRRKLAPSLALIKSYRTADLNRVVDGLRKSLSGVFVSLLLHVAALLTLALFVVYAPQEVVEPMELGWSTRVDPSNVRPDVAPAPITIPTVSVDSSTRSSTDVPTSAKDEGDDNRNSESGVVLADVSSSLKLRIKSEDEHEQGPSNRNSGIGREAIKRALEWIARQQQSDGSWSLNGPYPDGGTIETQTGATALALLAFLGDGQTHRRGDYQQEVQAGIDWLIKTQRANGDLFDIEEQGREAHFYAHSQATIALCEVLALTEDETLRGPATNAVQFLVGSQNPVLGGWKYRPLNADGIGDLSVTGWALMALHSARMAAIDVNYETFLLADRFLNSVQERSSNRAYYKYRPDFPMEESQRHSMTAEGLLCRQWLGWTANDPAMRRGVEFLMAEKNLPEWKPRRRNVYAWYYTAQTLHNMGGKHWEKWFGRVLPLLVKYQHKIGKLRGSWHPIKPPGAFHERSQDAGRLYMTVMCVLILETPYRHAPLYESVNDDSNEPRP